MTTNLVILLIIAFIIIASLSWYALSLLRLVSKQKQLKAVTLNNNQIKYNALDKKSFQSVLLITRAMQSEQCDFSEGCWRICVLLTSLQTQTISDTQFPAIFELYNEIKHFSILDDRKNLKKKDRMKQDLQRLRLEANLHDEIVKNLDLLHKYTLENIAILS